MPMGNAGAGSRGLLLKAPLCGVSEPPGERN